MYIRSPQAADVETVLMTSMMLVTELGVPGRLENCIHLSVLRAKKIGYHIRIPR